MKSFTKFLLALSAVFILSVLCTSASTSNNTKSTKTYEFDLTCFMDWYNGASFDKKTNLFTTKKDGGTVGMGVWNKKDFLNDYNCLVINYAAPEYGFFITLQYRNKNNETVADTVYCPSNLNEFVVPLKKEDVADDTFEIVLGAPWNHAANATINKITLENRDNPELSKSYKVPVAQAPMDNGPTKKIDDSLSAWDFLPKMGVGYQYSICAGYTYGMNFGMDSSYMWGYPTTKKETIHAIAERGFKTLRLQTTGFNHVIDENFTLDPDFLSMLKQVVDWAIEENMYVTICNGMDYYFPDVEYPYKSEEEQKEYKEYHDFQEEYFYGAGYNFNRRDKDHTEKYLKAFWTQICNTFNNSYDEHLVFETLNEGGDVTDHSRPKKDCKQCIDNYKYFNEVTQMIVDTIRNSGGNNAKRYIMISTYAQSPIDMLDAFKLPKDKTSKNKFIVAVHNYPMGCIPETKDADGNVIDYGDVAKAYTVANKNRIELMFSQLDKAFFKKKIPVAFTETGCPRHTNILERIYCMTDFINEVNKKGRSCSITLHVNSDINCVSDGFGYLDEETLKWYDDEFIDTLLNLAARRENKLSDEFIKNNELKVESIVGKELLKEDAVFDNWSLTKEFSSNTYCKSVPETYKIQFEYETIPGATENLLGFYYSLPENNFEWKPLANSNGLKGGTVTSDGCNINLNGSGTLILTIDKKSAQILEGYDSYIIGTGFILKSMKVVE